MATATSIESRKEVEVKLTLTPQEAGDLDHFCFLHRNVPIALTVHAALQARWARPREDEDEWEDTDD